MALKKAVDVKPATGKLGILLPGMGAVATTFIAGVLAIRRGSLAPPKKLEGSWVGILTTKILKRL